MRGACWPSSRSACGRCTSSTCGCTSGSRPARKGKQNSIEALRAGPGGARMKLPFTKMHGAGNDFVVIDATKQPFALSRAQLQRIADRHLGVGCDQVLVVEPGDGDSDFPYRIFNADGGEVEQCGNGARCFVKFVHGKGLTAKRELRVETLGGAIVPRLEPDGEVSVDMGPPTKPVFESLKVDGADVELAIVSMGNPHAVQVV